MTTGTPTPWAGPSTSESRRSLRTYGSGSLELAVMLVEVVDLAVEVLGPLDRLLVGDGGQHGLGRLEGGVPSGQHRLGRLLLAPRCLPSVVDGVHRPRVFGL